MQIFVKCLDGKTVVLDAKLSETIAVEKAKIKAKTGIELSEQRLLFSGRPLHDDELTFADYGIQDASTIHLTLCLVGGGKKRKKKAYTTPKKIKHVRKKVKLAVLKLYKIGDNDEVVRQRIECISPSCGGGIFMAKHENPPRHYCGKCHTTWVDKK